MLTKEKRQQVAWFFLANRLNEYVDPGSRQTKRICRSESEIKKSIPECQVKQFFSDFF